VQKWRWSIVSHILWQSSCVCVYLFINITYTRHSSFKPVIHFQVSLLAGSASHSIVCEVTCIDRHPLHWLHRLGVWDQSIFLPVNSFHDWSVYSFYQWIHFTIGQYILFTSEFISRLVSIFFLPVNSFDDWSVYGPFRNCQSWSLITVCGQF